MSTPRSPDCRTRCLDEYTAFDEAKLQLQTAGTQLGLRREMEVPIQSLLFRADDIEQERHRPPFLIQDAMELSALSCASVCNSVQASQTGLPNRCLLLAGLREAEEYRDLDGIIQTVALEIAVACSMACYCLPVDIRQYTEQWSGMEVSTLPQAGAKNGYPHLLGSVVSMHIATTFETYQPQFTAAVVQRESFVY